SDGPAASSDARGRGTVTTRSNRSRSARDSFSWYDAIRCGEQEHSCYVLARPNRRHERGDMPAAIPTLIPYMRKSGKEDPAISRDRQRRAIERWAQANSVELAPEVWEPGVSGSRPWQERGLGDAIQRCAGGEADGIVVEEQSRLSRARMIQTAEVW